MKTAIRVTVAAVVVALIGAWAGPAPIGPSAVRAHEEIARGIDVVAVCRDGRYRATITNIGGTIQWGALHYGVSQQQKGVLVFVRKVVLEPGATIAVTVELPGLASDLAWAPGSWVIPSGASQGQATGVAKEPLPAPATMFDWGAASGTH